MLRRREVRSLVYILFATADPRLAPVVCLCAPDYNRASWHRHGGGRVGCTIGLGRAAAASEIASGAPGKWGAAPCLPAATPRLSGTCAPAGNDE